MKFFVEATDAEFGTITYTFESCEDMRQAWSELGDDVQKVTASENGVRSLIFERCW